MSSRAGLRGAALRRSGACPEHAEDSAFVWTAWSLCPGQKFGGKLCRTINERPLASVEASQAGDARLELQEM